MGRGMPPERLIFFLRCVCVFLLVVWIGFKLDIVPHSSVVCVVCSVGPPLLVLSLVGDFPEPALECRCGAPRAGYHDRSRDVVLAPVTVLDYHGASVSVTSG
jgi:hypothetical protein